MLSRSLISVWTLIALASLGSAHMYMEQPVPFNLQKYFGDRAPLATDQYPCKFHDYEDWSNPTTLAVGKPQTLQLAGGAPHGGGSCQISLTLDESPTVDSVFKVIHSMVGMCPLIPTWNFSVPDSVPSGRAVFAWTWFAEQSGTPEMYMDCAPVEITGGATDDTAFKKLPNMLQANYDGAPGGCELRANDGNVDLIFPDPGESVETHWKIQQAEPTTMVGTKAFACGKSTPPRMIKTAPATSNQTPIASIAATNAGGVFAEGASSAPSPTPTASSTSTSVTAAATAPASSANGTTAPTPTAASADSDSQASCRSAKHGDLICNGTSQFGFCNWGKVVWQAVADGTVCENGTIKAANSARAAAEVKAKRAHGHVHGGFSVGRQFHA